MTVTRGDARKEIRDRLDEPQARAWSDTWLNGQIYEACKDIAKQTESLQTTGTIAVVAGTREYTLPSNLIRLTRAEFTPTGDPNRSIELEYVEFQNKGSIRWSDGAEGMPSTCTMFGPVGAVKIMLYPPPAYSGAMTIYYYKLPTALTDDTTVLDIPMGWENLVYLYVEYQALRKDRQPVWQEAKTLYDEQLAGMFDLTRHHSDQNGQIGYDRPGVNDWLYDMGDY